MTRYFKSKNGHTICATSSGNRSKAIPCMPHLSFNWIEIERNEFYRLKRKILKGKTKNERLEARYVNVGGEA